VGRWWDTVPREQWPEWQAEAIAADFEGEEGDRRQEIVFIGLGMDTARAKITKALDGCLLTDEEMEQYAAHCDSQGADPATPCMALWKEQQAAAAAAAAGAGGHDHDHSHAHAQAPAAPAADVPMQD